MVDPQGWRLARLQSTMDIIDFLANLYEANTVTLYLRKIIRATVMARASKEKMQANRDALMQSASRLFRERGFAAVTVAELVADAGLSAGGFYSQFESREALAALACSSAFEGPNRSWRHRLATSRAPSGLMKKYLDGYLSAQERDCVGISCAAASLVGDVARENDDSPVPEAFVAGLEGMLANVEALARAAGTAAKREEALAAVAMLVGALTLARASKATPLSNEMLKAVRRQIGRLFAT
jgi:TetR/AcrR family transcriptional repressor of nem operon